MSSQWDVFLYSVTPILEDLLKEPSGCFENFCRLSSHDFEYLLKNISPYSCSSYSHLGTVDIEEEILAPCSWGHEQGNMSSLLPLQNIPRKSSYETKNFRDEFAEYFTAVVLSVQWIPNNHQKSNIFYNQIVG
ncbi:hypothetical protein Anas_06784 [Armadillidium nasatum]|uniref:Uncharacterized protein n=1 Tax=Armadillidium nasatum TaxID=96803 RepID=A0A5N5TFP3_9CRUS|nr:hypothetical protein Anas_06784 [Armadillidium nasatum]